MYALTVRRAALAAAAATASIVLLAACGNDSGTGADHSKIGAGNTKAPSGQSSNVNDQDVAFATNMIGHHRQAVEMAKIAPAHDAGAEVKTLAAKIEAAQQPEIDTMSGWLTAWGKDVPMAGMDHGAAAMPGMMTATQMEDLNKAKGTAFDAMFLQMMMAHHQGALEMAKTEQSAGKNDDAKALAAKVITDQTAEIATMQKMRSGK